MNKKIFIAIIILYVSLFVYAEEDFENNFLSGYLDMEKFFLNMNGDYGTTFFPFLLKPYGGRDLALSGAFTGVADDVSTIESNPAGTSSLDATELFFSHSKVYGDINYNTVAYTMRFNELGMGLSARVMYLPFTRYDMLGNALGSSVISYTVVTLNASYNFLSTYKHFGLAVGGNVKLYVYSVPEEISAGQTSLNVAFDLGLLTKFNFIKFYNTFEKNWAIGLAVKNLGPFTRDEPPPTTASFGLSYKPVEQFMVSSDINLLINYSDLTYKNWGVNIGLEWRFIKFASITAGASIKSNPTFSLGFNLNLESLKVTAVYNPDLVDLAQFTISATIKLGDLGRKKRIDDVNNKYALTLKMINEGKTYDAQKALEDIILINPNFDPAWETLTFLKKHIETLNKVNEAVERNEMLFE